MRKGKRRIWPRIQRPRMETSCGKLKGFGGAVAQLGARLDGIEEVVGSNPIGSTIKPGVRPGDMGDTTYLRHG